jgi:hypothetical protein
MPDDNPPAIPSSNHFDMATAHQMALDALRAWQRRMVMPGTAVVPLDQCFQLVIDLSHNIFHLIDQRFPR